MEAKRLIPYSVHLREDVYTKLKEAAGNRKASALVRDAITLIVDGGDQFSSGYNKGVRDSAQIVYECDEAQMVAIKGRDLGDILTDRIKELEMK